MDASRSWTSRRLDASCQKFVNAMVPIGKPTMTDRYTRLMRMCISKHSLSLRDCNFVDHQQNYSSVDILQCGLNGDLLATFASIILT